ncbi:MULTISPECIES: hypothetical protein [unclassified Sphingopyxis]|uniref:hypothetical protein n=1 Tax=unclassified Sphingopyxis TaxID=2614943 RepID=UPI0012E35343|nr:MULTISPECIES: hypothetical protein [unclassified Sphingopyxis]
MELYNAYGKLQIGASAANYYCIQKGTVTAPACAVDGSGNATNFYFSSGAVEITPTVAYDIMAVRGRGGARPRITDVAPSTVAANTTTTLQIQGTGGFVDWWVFRSYTALTPSTSGFGMEIVNPATGKVNFTTKQPKILKCSKYVLPSLGGVVPGGTAGLVNVTLPTGRDYAFFAFGTAQTIYDHYDGLINPRFSMRATAAWSNGNVAFRREAIEFFAGGETRQAGSGVMMCDVTGY